MYYIFYDVKLYQNVIKAYFNVTNAKPDLRSRFSPQEISLAKVLVGLYGAPSKKIPFRLPDGIFLYPNDFRLLVDIHENPFPVLDHAQLLPSYLFNALLAGQFILLPEKLLFEGFFPLYALLNFFHLDPDGGHLPGLGINRKGCINKRHRQQREYPPSLFPFSFLHHNVHPALSLVDAFP